MDTLFLREQSSYLRFTNKDNTLTYPPKMNFRRGNASPGGFISAVMMDMKMRQLPVEGVVELRRYFARHSDQAAQGSCKVN